MKIYAPVNNVNGVYASVLFKNSVGETNNPALIEWFKAHGYRVEESPKVRQEDLLTKVVETIEETVETPTQPDFESMTPLELRDWMKENGYGNVIKNIRNKEKLLELLKK
jgi:hypothetical protein